MSEKATKSAIQQMAEKIMPGIQTDHGSINLGDIVVLIMSSVLLIYTGYRSWHFLTLSIPGDFQVLALVGLWGIDIAMVGWAVTWIFGSSSAGQDGVSMAMWIIDVLAMVLTSVIDTIMYADSAGIPAIMKTIAWWGVPLIIVGNAVMAIIYHFTSPETKYRRDKRKADAKLREAQQKGDAEIDDITATANMLQDYSLKRANALLSIANVADQNTKMVELEQAVIKKLNTAGLGHLTGDLSKSLGVNEQSPTEKPNAVQDALKEKIEQVKSLVVQSKPKDDDGEDEVELQPALISAASTNGHKPNVPFTG